MQAKWLREKQREYGDWLCKDLLAYWDRMLDREYGGVYTCISNAGDKLLSTDKYVWSQGRMLWVLSHLCGMGAQGLAPVQAEHYLPWAEKTADFLLEHAVLPPGEGVCAFLLTREGAKKEQSPGSGFYTSYFVDCFVAMGLAEFGRVFGRPQYVRQAGALFERTLALLDAGVVRSQPYLVRPGCDAHSRPMILCNTANVLARAMQSVDAQACAGLQRLALECAGQVMDLFYDPASSLIAEVRNTDGAPAAEDDLLLRHAAPGHAIECMWILDDTPGLPAALSERAAQVALASLKAGWDSAYGGLLRYCDIAGGAPRGDAGQDAFAQLISSTWGTKLWWVHSEALYTTLRLYAQTGDPAFLEWHRRVHEYAFSHFPNPDKEVGEWTQVLDREGQPLEQTVALPVKDPYHLMRNAMQLVELLADEAVWRQS